MATSEPSSSPTVERAGTDRNPVTREVDAAPEEVFGVLSQGWLYPTWVVGAARMRAVDADWPREGAELSHSVGVWPFLLNDHTVVLRSEPPRRLVLRARGWPVGEAIVDLRIVALPGGRSRVTIAEDASDGPGRLVPGPLRRAVIARRNDETLRRLAFIAEGRSASTGGPTGQSTGT